MWDLKPSNIFLVSSAENGVAERSGGGSDFVKIMDFGIAKQTALPIDLPESARPGRPAPAASFDPQLTAAGAILGTPYYLSPEQARGASVEVTADQYSLGCILFEMLTGTVPFDAPKLTDLLYLHLSAPPPVLSERHPAGQFSDPLKQLVARLLAKESAQRFPSLRELQQELQKELDRLGEKAHQAQSPQLGQRRFGRRMLPLFAAAAGVLLGCIFLVRTLWPPGDGRPLVAAIAAAELGWFRQHALDVLRQDLHSPQSALRLAAISALGHVRAPEAQAELAALLTSADAADRPLAAYALVQLGAPAGRQFLEHELAAADIEVQLRAAFLLCETDHPEAQRLLWAAVTNHRLAEPMLLDVLFCLAHTSQPAAARAQLLTRFHAADATPAAARIPIAARLTALGEPAAPAYLHSLLARGGVEQLAAARALASPLEPDLATLFRRILASRLAQKAARILASEGLGQSGDTQDVRLLGLALQPAADPELRQAAATAILQLCATDPAALGEQSLRWAKSALSDASWATRVAAIAVLAESRSPQAVGLLAQLLTDRDPRVRGRAARALGSHREPAAVLALRDSLRDGDSGVRGEALQALRRLLFALTRTDLASLKQTVRGWLLDLVGDPGKAQQVLARTLLLMLGDETQRSILQGLLQSPDPELRRLRIELGDPDPAQLVIALEDADWGVRRSAALRLALAHDRRALGVLTEAVGRGGSDALTAYGPLRALGEAVPAQPQLLAALDLSQPLPDRLAAVDSAAHLPATEAVAVLQRAARDPDPQVRQASAVAAADLMGADAPSSAVLRLLSQDHDPAVRALAAALIVRRSELAPPSAVQPGADPVAIAADLAIVPALPDLQPAAPPDSGDAAAATATATASVEAELGQLFAASEQAFQHGDLGRAIKLLNRTRILCARATPPSPACAARVPAVGLLLAHAFEQQKRWPEAMVEYQNVLHSGGKGAEAVTQQATAQRAVVLLGLKLGKVVIHSRSRSGCREKIEWLIPGIPGTIKVDGKSEQVLVQANQEVHRGQCR